MQKQCPYCTKMMDAAVDYCPNCGAMNIKDYTIEDYSYSTTKSHSHTGDTICNEDDYKRVKIGVADAAANFKAAANTKAAANSAGASAAAKASGNSQSKIPTAIIKLVLLFVSYRAASTLVNNYLIQMLLEYFFNSGNYSVVFENFDTITAVASVLLTLIIYAVICKPVIRLFTGFTKKAR